MSPREYMWLGVSFLLHSSIVGLLGYDGVLTIWVAFVGGALFGKGYRAWEGRKSAALAKARKGG